MNNYKLKKTSVKLIPFRSSSQNSSISVKGAFSILLETERHFANDTFYVIKNNVKIIIIGELAILRSDDVINLCGKIVLITSLLMRIQYL